MRRDERTFRPDNKEDRVTDILVYRAVELTVFTRSIKARQENVRQIAGVCDNLGQSPTIFLQMGQVTHWGL